jgi:D-alanyl-lipoteichoic acid acyltransferase DltB (MBOAT superfamily)
MFFPQLVAGPIERPQNLLFQFKREGNFDGQQFTNGTKLLAWGLFKKVVIADRLAMFVNPVFENPGNFDSSLMTLAIVFFYFQIYCDFSGYSDIARGSARMMGFELMNNFNLPFLAKSLTEFWKRWHISLSTWLGDYVYEPLALHWRNYEYLGISAALMITFFISGLWHGAKWTFVIWGLLHGLMLAIEVNATRIFKARNSIFPTNIGNLFGVCRTFSLVCISYVFFRANSINDAFLILNQIANGLLSFKFSISGIRVDFFKDLAAIGQTPKEFYFSSLLIILLIIIEKVNVQFPLTIKLALFPSYVRVAIYQAFLLFMVIYGVWFTGNKSFIYFQF